MSEALQRQVSLNVPLMHRVLSPSGGGKLGIGKSGLRIGVLADLGSNISNCSNGGILYSSKQRNRDQSPGIIGCTAFGYMILGILEF